MVHGSTRPVDAATRIAAVIGCSITSTIIRLRDSSLGFFDCLIKSDYFSCTISGIIKVTRLQVRGRCISYAFARAG